MTGARSPMSTRQQAEFIGELAKRCVLLDGTIAKESFLMITAGEAEDLKMLADRLHRMSAHEPAIRRVVTGR